MRIAVAVDNGEISAHFGRCAAYAIYEAVERRVVGKRVINNPGHSPGFLPRFLKEQGVSVVIAGGMGPRAREIFEGHGIKVLTGIAGDPDDAVRRFLEGSLHEGQDLCEHPGERCVDDHHG